MMHRCPWAAPAVLALLAGCGAEPAAVDDTAPPADAGNPPTHRIAIPATVRSNLGITFATAEVRHVAQTLRVPGAFELEPLARHEYRMALPGEVHLLVDQYDSVEPGQPLYGYRSPSWPELLHEVLIGEQAMASARAGIAVAEARLEEARTRAALAADRIEALAQADFRKVDLEVEAAALRASLPRLESELALARTRLANAERTREHALHRAATAAGLEERTLTETVSRGGEEVPRYLTIDTIEVRAVEAGVVERLAVTDGSFVEPPALVLSTVDPGRLRFRASALQADLPRLADAREASIVPPPSPGLPLDGGVPARWTVGLEAHPEHRTLEVVAIPLGDADWMRPGVSAFLEIVTASTERPAIAVPRSAVVQDGLTHVVFRRDPADPNQAIRLEADLGVSDGRWVVLQSGLMAGDEVVLDGAYELKLASESSGVSQAGGHVHADGSFHGDH